MKRAKTKAELEADNFKNTSHEKPLRGEPQLVINLLHSPGKNTVKHPTY